MDREHHGPGEDQAPAAEPAIAWDLRNRTPPAGKPALLAVRASRPDIPVVDVPLVPGSTVKHYEIIREIGQGGMGDVFLAWDTRLARRCAIKLLLECRLGAGRFLAEAQATACCKHDNIVTIYEIDEIGGHPYMVLEYLEGRTLRAWMDARDPRDPVPAGIAVELVIPVVRALACAHDLGIVHRDLKPENIFLTDAGQVKVLDFGVAKRIGGDEIAGPTASARASGLAGEGLTAQGVAIGTQRYMSPEQWLCAEIGPETDIWAAGVILFELVTGSHPLEPATMPRLLEVQDLGVPMPSVHERRADAGALGDIIDRCLNKRRSERIGSARELLAALEPLAAGRTASAAAARRGRRRWRAALVAAGAAAVVAASAVVATHPATTRAARSTGTAITDAPPPPSLLPEARAAYQAALHGFRDASWAVAEIQLRRAIALDPLLAPAHLRLAILLAYTTGRSPEARQDYAVAVGLRSALGDRDRDILAAFEPLFTHDRSGLGDFPGRLTALGRRRADDAEVQVLLAYFGGGSPEEQLRAARRAVAIDPAYADAWQAAGKQLFALGRADEALRAFDTCRAVSPAAVDCLGERAQLHAARGECAAAEADLHDAVAANPLGRYWRDLQASSSMALGKPVETAIEALAQKWAVLPEVRRELVELHDRVRLDVLRGHLADARAGALALRARTLHQPDADQHARYTTLLIDLAIEADQLGDAAQIADDYLRRRDAWIGEGSIGDDLAMLTVLRDAGQLPAGEFDARRAAWLDRHRDLTGRMRTEAWLAAWVRPSTSRDAAVAALAAAPPGDLRVLVRTLEAHAEVGAVLLRAGRAAEAVPFLDRAARGCDGLLAPVAHVRAAARLGQALEATGDVAGACAAYQRVVDRWGAAAAVSRTTRDAELRRIALRCAPEASGASAGDPRSSIGR